MTENGPKRVFQAGELGNTRGAKASHRFCPLTVYDGTVFAGSIVERAGTFTAYDVNHRRIGSFASQRDATRAIPSATRP